MARGTRRTEAAVAVGVVVLHALGVYALARLDAATRQFVVHDSDEQHGLDVEFVEIRARGRASPEAGPTTVRAGGVNSRVHVAPTPAVTTETTAGEPQTSVESAPARPVALNLTLPESRQTTGADPRGAWLERRPTLDPRTTRFATTWSPDGSALEQARFRSKVVDIAVGLFGAPPRKCNEVEQRLRMPDCMSPDADAFDAQALRRSVER